MQKKWVTKKIAKKDNPLWVQLHGEQSPIGDIQWDAWHCEKSALGNPLRELAKRKDMPLVKLWVKPLRTHWYWSLRSSRTGGRDGPVNVELAVEKFRSAAKHICNSHEWPRDDDFTQHKRCQHEPIPEAEQRKIAWIPKDTEEYKVVKEIIYSEKLAQLMEGARNLYRTSENENYHSVRTGKYLPKRLFQGLQSMCSKTELTGLDRNNNRG